jgi:hypothetical protein
VAAAAAVLVVLGVAAALRLVAVADDLQEARDLLTAAGDQVEAGTSPAPRTGSCEPSGCWSPLTTVCAAVPSSPWPGTCPSSPEPDRAP